MRYDRLLKMIGYSVEDGLVLEYVQAEAADLSLHQRLPFSANDVDNEIAPIGMMTRSLALVLYNGNIIAFIRVEGQLPASFGLEILTLNLITLLIERLSN